MVNERFVDSSTPALTGSLTSVGLQLIGSYTF